MCCAAAYPFTKSKLGELVLPQPHTSQNSSLPSTPDSSRRLFSGGDFFLPALRSGEGLAREVDGEGGRRGAGELDFGLMGSDLVGSGLIEVCGSSGNAIRNGGASTGVFTDTAFSQKKWENAS
ncbi:hypothetical protein Adt_38877 [Abeliophyllum distichum]|uniref:Uncharacterized protein n=1 Tax=Abeliophyllum distichum TaxID=126358 RepID=A0ABD1Q7M7_9LAMI